MKLSEVQGLSLPVMAKVFCMAGKQHGTPALLLEVTRRKALVKPLGHRRADWVPLDEVKLWKSRNAA